AHHSEEIFDKYIIRVADGYKISYEDLLSKILIACADIIYFDLKHLITLNAFTLDKTLEDLWKKLLRELENHIQNSLI
ncbi:29347_t:CDS:2, partial [Racocetra persica]